MTCVSGEELLLSAVAWVESIVSSLDISNLSSSPLLAAVIATRILQKVKVKYLILKAHS
jgi:hypothetical protein